MSRFGPPTFHIYPKGLFRKATQENATCLALFSTRHQRHS